MHHDPQNVGSRDVNVIHITNNRGFNQYSYQITRRCWSRLYRISQQDSC